MPTEITQNGFIARVGPADAAPRSIVAGSNKVAVTNGDGSAGNASIDLNEGNFAVPQANVTGLVSALAGKQTAPSEGPFADGDKTKLDGIEAAATADQTPAEIVASINGELGGTAWQTGGSTPTWGGITGTLSSQTDLQAALDGKSATGHGHSGADVTIIGATAGNALVTDASGNIIDGGSPPGGTGTTNITIAESPTGVEVQSSNGTNDTIALANGTNAGAMSPAHYSKLEAVEPGATADQTAAEILSAVQSESGRTLATDGAKLDGIATGATANPSALDNVSDDAAPQLGGNLDVQSNQITTSVTNGDIVLSPNGSGAVSISGVGYEANVTADNDIPNKKYVDDAITGAGGYTDENAQDAVGTILTDTTSVSFVYNDAGGTIAANVLPAGVDHDSLSGFVANEHIDWTQDQGATNIDAGNIPDLSGSYATAAQGALADSALQSVAAADITDSTVAGRAVLTAADANPFTGAEQSKLSGIEGNATADQTGAEMVTAINAELGGTSWQVGGSAPAWGDVTGTLSAQTDLQAALDSKQNEPAEGAFADGDKTKLDGVEAGADVTDTANVTAAGALMDSEVTNLAAVKAFDPAAYATAAQGATADAALQPGDVDDVPVNGQTAAPVSSNWAYDHSNASNPHGISAATIGVEPGATADQTGAEIKAAYEAEADTNAYTDAEKTKLAGVAAGAVADHGALSGLTDDDHTQYHTDARGDARYYTQAQVDSSLAGKSDSGHTHSAATTSAAGFLSASDKTKLDAIESGATADQTGTEIVAAIDSELGGSTWQSGGGSSAWGGITGTLSDQTDLQAALDGKSASSHNHDGTYAPDDILDSTISGDANNTITVSPKFWSGTQANYDAIGTKDANTIYLIQE